MNRRTFLTRAALVVGGLALNEVIPFGRVYSFPSEIKIADKWPDIDYSNVVSMSKKYIVYREENGLYSVVKEVRVGDILIEKTIKDNYLYDIPYFTNQNWLTVDLPIGSISL